MRKYPSSKVRSSGCALWSSHEEIPHAKGKKNPSKMVGVARGHQRAGTLKPYSQKTSQSYHTRTTALSNSVKLSHAVSTQDGQIMVENSDKTWPTGEGNGKPLQYSCLKNPMNSMKRQKDMILLEKSREIGPEGMKRLSQSRNNAQLWVCLVVNIKSDALKNNTA